MKNFCSTTTVGVVAVALGVALSGCGSATQTDTQGTTSAAETTAQTPAETSAATPPSAAAPVAGMHPTLQDYFKQNNITETPVKRGDPGAPNVQLPRFDGWRSPDPLPEEAYAAFRYEQPKETKNPPQILAVLTKLTGDVDPSRVLSLAPNAVRNLPGYQGPAQPDREKLDNRDAVLIAGIYDKDGAQVLVAQKTVLIPTDAGLYVLQIKVQGEQADGGPLMDATSAIDKETKITP